MVPTLQKLPNLKLLLSSNQKVALESIAERSLKHSFNKNQIEVIISNMSDEQSSHSAHCYRSGAESCGKVYTKRCV